MAPVSEGFTAEDRIKLTYHVDGFAQFSGENPGKIISGRDQKTGEPKGFGLFTHSLKTPVVSGPSVKVTVWGIEEFETAKEDDEPIIFEPSDFYYRGSTPNNANDWKVSIYAFPVGAVPPLRFEGDQAIMQFVLNPLNAGVPGSVVELKTIYLEAEQLYLGMFVERYISKFPMSSGWLLSGPGNYTMSQSGYVLEAIYPRDAISIEGRDSLDRNPSNP